MEELDVYDYGRFISFQIVQGKKVNYIIRQI